MTVCNRCGSPMVPDITALVPALGCTGCGRLVPMTGVKAPKGDRRQLARSLRAAQRTKLAREAQRAAPPPMGRGAAG